MSQEKTFHFPNPWAGLARNTDPDTSKEAAQKAPNLKLVVLEAIKKFPDGCIADDVVDALNMRWDTVTPRFAPLLKEGLIVDTGWRRKGRTGRSQRVVKAVL